ncbi:FKBP-type peptidyl-prolyl cis-trans isomerase N-terminal domain-containing protein [Francisella sp. LA112445]|uniref:FKBP-type peptidyl-prolyl cis-trans isomerase N-terminal domain-containing protein n=1 Tax=Francisella sp. LA112445 TaxID=1395624 RepID=UPI001788A96E|nr:FKBP-type peptidyl-prolyl cis-trans isomerase N-terminal domain-containing protein [Francisella sp. LA112445]QIW10312.1 phage infection protein [Francisella sp. LA112445]
MKLTKTLLVAPLVAGALISSSFAATDTKSNISYSVGYTMGKTLQAQMQQNNVTADSQQVVDGLKDGINAKKPKLTPEQMQTAMMDFQKQAMAAQKNSK